LKPAAALDDRLQLLLHRLRPGQRAMGEWIGGELAVSAVPGAGKSTGMAAAAALTVARQRLNLRRYLVVVTFTRSATNNLKAKICANLAQLGLPPLGFSVNTLHGLALQIASRHRDRAGLDLDTVTLIAPNQSHRLIRTCVDRWIAADPPLYQQLLEGQSFDGEEAERLRRQSVLRTEILPDLAHTVIREAKSSGLGPEQLRSLALGSSSYGHPQGRSYDILTVAAGLYDQYQTQLQSQNLIDYEDMILGALRVLEDPALRQFWQDQVFGVFEDEAQDSTPLQSELLEILATTAEGDRNLVRVGDPNQAINSTFTPADPSFFQGFCQRCQSQGRLVELDQAGRSTAQVMAVANQMIHWVNDRVLPPGLGTGPGRDRPQPQISPERLPFRLQDIRPVDPGDPQADANPAPLGVGVEILQPPTIDHSIALIRQRIGAIVAQDPEPQIAILVRENRQGQFLAQHLGDLETELGVRLYEVGQQQRQSHVPRELWQLVQFLQRPHSPDALKAALAVLADRQRIAPQDFNALAIAPEQFLYPGPLDRPLSPPAQRLCTQLLRARLELPLGDLLGFLASSLAYGQGELATADKLIDQALQRMGGERSLEALERALGEIVSSERFDPVDTEDPESLYGRKGQVTIITMHKAKGLDWDYVFVPFLQANVIPGQMWVPQQAQFLGDFTLGEVARTQIRHGLHQVYRPGEGLPQQWEGVLLSETQAWEEAAYRKRSEEYRLLYVALTRAKKLLWLSAAQQAPFNWKKPEKLDRQSPCPVIPALIQHLSLPRS